MGTSAVTSDEERFLRSKGFASKRPSVWFKRDRSGHGTFTAELYKRSSGRWEVEVGEEVDGDWMGGPAPVPMASTVQQAVSSALTGISNLKRDWGRESSPGQRREQVSPRFKRALEAEVRRLMEATVQVKNLSTGKIQTFSGITPMEAVIAAYAQSKGDFNTWDYKKRYGNRVRRGKWVYTIGDFSVFQDGRRIEAAGDSVFRAIQDAGVQVRNAYSLPAIEKAIRAAKSEWQKVYGEESPVFLDGALKHSKKSIKPGDHNHQVAITMIQRAKQAEKAKRGM